MAEDAAREFRLPGKGRIAVACDADLVLVNPEADWAFDRVDCHSKARELYLVYEGTPLFGKVVKTSVSGVTVFDRGQVVGQPGQGRFVRRDSIRSGCLARPTVLKGMIETMLTRPSPVRSRFLCLFMAAVMLLLTAACATSRDATSAPATHTAPSSGGGQASTPPDNPKPGGRLVIGRPAEPDSYDPHRTTSTNAAYVFTLIYDTLLHIDYDLKTITPGLARSWEASPDGKTYTFKLRDDVKFHSGRNFTSADVKFTFGRLLDPKSASPHKFRLDTVDTIETPDDTTVVLKLKAPASDLLMQLTNPFLGIIDREAVEKYGDKYGSSGAGGTGPFMFVEWVRNDHTTLKRFDQYRWGPTYYKNKGPAYVEEVIYRTIPETQTLVFELEAGNIQSAFSVKPDDIEVLRKNANVRILEAKPYQHLQYLAFKTTRPGVNDINVRKAINAALNKEQIVRDVQKGHGVAAQGLALPTTLDYWPGQEQIWPTGDVNQAKMILDAAGWKPGADGIRVKNGQRLSLVFFGITGLQDELSTLLQAQLKAVGVDVQIRLVDLSAYFPALRNQDYDLFSLDYPYATLLEMLALYFSSGNIPSPNRMMWKDERTDGLLARARAATTDAERSRAVQELQKIVAENYLWAPLWHRVLLVPTRVEVKGFRPHGIYGQAYYKLIDLWLDKK